MELNETDLFCNHSSVEILFAYPQMESLKGYSSFTRNRRNEGRAV